MARDYKSLRHSRPAAPRTPGWVWLLLGLIPGLFIALVIYLGGFNLSNTASVPAAILARPTPPPTPVVEARGVASQAQPKALPQAPPAKPRFDFYTILPEMEVAVPEKEISGKTEPANAKTSPPNNYILQAGSFRSFEEADRLKANLTLLGVEAHIQTVTVNNKDTWHRVHIGPYHDLPELNQVRARLKQNRIDAVILKIKT